MHFHGLHITLTSVCSQKQCLRRSPRTSMLLYPVVIFRSFSFFTIQPCIELLMLLKSVSSLKYSLFDFIDTTPSWRTTFLSGCSFACLSSSTQLLNIFSFPNTGLYPFSSHSVFLPWFTSSTLKSSVSTYMQVTLKFIHPVLSLDTNLELLWDTLFIRDPSPPGCDTKCIFPLSLHFLFVSYLLCRWLRLSEPVFGVEIASWVIWTCKRMKVS